MLSTETKEAILRLQKSYPQKRSALIPALHIAQNEIGYLPKQVQQEIAELFGIDQSEVHSLVTFYDMFHEEPIGKHVIHVCKNVSCMLRGCDKLINALCHKLDITCGQTTKDGEFTVIASECLAACDRAPMLLVDDKVVGPIAIDDLDHMLEEAKKGPGHPSPLCAGDVQHG